MDQNLRAKIKQLLSPQIDYPKNRLRNSKKNYNHCYGSRTKINGNGKRG